MGFLLGALWLAITQVKEGDNTMRVIYLPALERNVSLSVYVKAVKTAKANPQMEFKTGLTTWWPTTGKEIMRQFYAGLTDRINDGTSYIVRGTAR